MAEIVTANKLHTGTVVYLDAHGRWIEALNRAAVANDAEILKRLEAIAAESASRNEVTAIYAFPVRLVDGCAEPISVREKIRAAHAPTV